MSSSVEQLSYANASLRGELDAQCLRTEAAEATIESLSTRLKEAQSKLCEQQAVIEEYSSERSQIFDQFKAVEAGNQSLKSELNRLISLHDEQRQAMQREFDQTVRGMRVENERRIKHLSEQIDKARAGHNTLTEEMKAARSSKAEEAQGMRAELRAMTMERDNLDAELSRVTEEKDAELETLRGALSKSENDRQHALSRMSDLESSRPEASEDPALADSLATAIAKFKAQRESCLAWRERAQALDAQLKTKEAELSATGIDGRRAHMAVKESIVQLNEAASTTQRLRRELHEAQKRAEVLETQLEGLGVLAAKREVDPEKNQLVVEMARLEAERKHLENERMRRQAEVGELRTKVERTASVG
ncbi:Chromosome partition protein Smc [Carpediemonas membranifera]|uniref:Chromosome partition protein Smc n=1 Tax=Carpediemonas membranifera TaxID=201153 RepID=A0A8J6B1Q4_9EUKA|nr:Chromosome partition protein Smc [Carpediemonas membranifera]|eukprot:KAG9396570.1 Chromosome partition protein Smc [Carpediemonas membranifera]